MLEAVLVSISGVTFHNGGDPKQRKYPELACKTLHNRGCLQQSGFDIRGKKDQLKPYASDSDMRKLLELRERSAMSALEHAVVLKT